MKKAGMFMSRFLLLFIVFLTVFPFYLLLVNSVKWHKEIITEPWALPVKLHFGNFVKAFEQLWRPMANTMFVTVCVIALVLLVASLAGYAFSRFQFKGSNILLMVIMAMLMIPGFVVLIPQFVQLNKLGMYNSYGALIFPPVAGLSVTATFLLKNAMEAIPKSLFEAADMEGAREWQILAKIVVPLVKPTMATVMITTGLTTWNNYLWPLVATSGESTKQISVAITQMIRTTVEGDGIAFAGYIIASLPILILFCFANKAFVSGISGGAVKG